MAETLKLTADTENIGNRIDKLVSENAEGITRSAVQGLLEKGMILVNGGAVSKNYKLKNGDVIDIEYQDLIYMVRTRANKDIYEPRIIIEDEDFLAEFKECMVGSHYTKFSHVMGAGYSNPHLGDSVWPQLNMMYIIYCEKAEAKKIRQIIIKLRKKYLTEGIACFMSQAMEL